MRNYEGKWIRANGKLQLTATEHQLKVVAKMTTCANDGQGQQNNNKMICINSRSRGRLPAAETSYFNYMHYKRQAASS